MRGMAITRLASTAVTRLMATLNMRLWPESDGGRSPGPGDLVVICPLRPHGGVVGPPGWTAEHGVFWKVLNAGDGPDVKLTAPYGTEWEAEVYMLPAGTYSLPPSGDGSAVPWETPLR